MVTVTNFLNNMGCLNEIIILNVLPLKFIIDENHKTTNGVAVDFVNLGEVIQCDSPFLKLEAK